MKVVHLITTLALAGIALDLIRNANTINYPENHGWLILGLLVVNVLFGSKMEDSLLGLWIRRKSLEQKAKIEELSQQRQPQ